MNYQNSYNLLFNKLFIMKNLLFIILIISFWGCNTQPHFTVSNVENTAEIIDVTTALENESLKIDDIIDSMSLIILETNDESLLSSIDQIVIGDEYIYVLDAYQLGSVAIFTKDGKFLKRISQGNGPGEINRAMSIAYDKYARQLLVQDIRALNVYSEQGEFVKDVNFNYLYGELIALKNNYLFFQYDFQNLETNFPSFFLTDKSFKVTDLFYINYKRYVMGHNFMSSTDDCNQIIFHRPLDNSIYLIKSDGSISTKYSFSFSDLEANTDKYDYCRDNSFDRELDNSQGGKYYFSGDFAETDNYIFLRYSKIRYGDVYLYINKKNKEMRCGVNPLFTSKLLPNMGMLVGSYNNCFVKYLPLEFFGGINVLPEIIEANKDYLSKEDLDKLKNYKQDDNPLLFFYKLK